MSRTILLAWELGSGLGHVAHLRRIATRLRPHGVKLVAALKDLSLAHWLDGLGLTIIQAPIWPVAFKSDAASARMSSATMADSLADFGLADEEAFQALLIAWDHLLRLIRPDLVIADYAPAAALAARGKLPLALVGNGFTLPPAEMERFPPLHQAAAPVWREENLLDIVNRALRRLSSPSIERLPQLFAADVRAVATFPLLDPYREARARPADGPFLDQAPIARRADAETVLAYFSLWPDARADILDLLQPLARRLRVFAPGLSRAYRDALARAGAMVEAKPMQLAEALAESRIVIHIGSNGLATQALAAGVPQLVLSMDVEKELVGQALEGAGAGGHVRAYDPATHLSDEMIEELVCDADVAARAADLGSLHRQALSGPDPLSTFAAACTRFLAI